MTINSTNQPFTIMNMSGGSKFSIVMAMIYAAISALFLLSVALELSWRFVWVAFGVISAWSITSSALRVIRFEIAQLDAVLIPLSLFFVAILQPFVFALSGLGFPYAWGTEINDNQIANGTGAILSVFLTAYFAGRISFRLRPGTKQNATLKKSPESNLKISTGLIFLFSVIATYPFFFFGSNGLLQNLLINMTGRQTGYVAFSEGAMGSTDPISVLMAQLIPVMVLLNGILAVNEKKFSKKALHLFLLVILFVLLVSLGGRTWLVMIVLTLLCIIYFDSRRFRERLFFFGRLALLTTLVIGTLEYQVKQRHSGIEGASSSGLVGFDVNREIALVYHYASTRDGFVIANTPLEQIVMPIPTYFFFMITNPIPRIIWSGKPFDPSFVYVNLLRNGDTGLGTGSNVTITIPGRAYVNFGWSGVIQHAFVLGFILSRLSRRILQTPTGSVRRIVYIFAICLVAVNVRELQAGKFYPIFWMIFIAWTQRFLSRVSRGSSAP